MAELQGHDMQPPTDIQPRLDRDPELKQLVLRQQLLLETSREAFRGEVNIAWARIRQYQQKITGLEELKSLQAKRVQLLEEELSSIRSMFEKGFASQVNVSSQLRSVSAVEEEFAETLVKISEAQSAISEQEIRIKNLELKRMESVSEQLTRVEESLLAVAPVMGKLETRIRRSSIRAPASGIVLGLNQFTLGGVIAPGETVLDIVPEKSNLIIEARFSPQDIDEIAPGMTANIRFTPYSYRESRSVGGVLTQVSADVIADPQRRQSYYTGVIAETMDEVQKQGIVLYPGMPAQVMITLKSRSVVDYLLEPLWRSFDRALRES